MFGTVVEGVNSSKIDRYADSILLGIAWQYDAEHPMESVMRSAYYHRDYHNENQNLLDAVEQELPANLQYLRYWHGSIAVVRPLLLWMPLEGIYRLNGILLILFTGLPVILLIRRGGAIPALGLLLGMVLVSVWFVPLSLEYAWMFLLMPLFSLIALELGLHGGEKWYGTAFLCFGMLANFFDFLTTETLTLTVPLLLLLWAEKKEGQRDGRAALGTMVRLSLAWVCGFAGAWSLKWALASLAMGESALPYVTGHIVERIGGTGGVPVRAFGLFIGAVFRNIYCLFPLEYGIPGILAGMMLPVGFAYVAYVYRGQDYDGKRLLAYVLIGCIPYVRFLVLHNHSYLHCFFTYRAQLGTVLAMALILEELGVWKVLRRSLRHGK